MSQFGDEYEGPFHVKILWGEAPEEGDEPQTYTFPTKAEKDAFMLGLAEMEGWMGYREIEDGYRYDFDLRELVRIDGEDEVG